ncbi:MAG: CHASE2 domain-containing protein [Deltaproteobacteria bacterium]|nr:CHASE2 domain-containing protein [Deltaproteobacteria bacterium]
MVKKSLFSIILGLLSFALIHFISTQTTFFTQMERALLDGFYFMREPGVTERNPFVSGRAILLGYDEKSLATIGKWPWKRYVHAQFLNKIEQFSPQAVMFDILFVKPETLPPFFSNRMKLNRELVEDMNAALAKMDRELAQALKRYDNVYLDLQLIEGVRKGLPEKYQNLIMFNEFRIQEYSQPTQDNESVIVFHSLEPILRDYVRNAHPAVINVIEDDDGVIRYFPLYYTYRNQGGEFRNIHTVVLLLLKDYFHVRDGDIVLKPEGVVLRSAKVPEIDWNTGQERVVLRDFDPIAKRIGNPEAPDSYHYNQNLYNFLVNQVLLDPLEEERLPYFPLRLIVKDGEGYEILGGWEIFDAATRVRSKKIDVIFYHEQDIDIRTPVTGLFRINYSGTEKRVFLDPVSGKPKIHHTVPTKSYVDAYALDELPNIPPLNRSGKMDPNHDTRMLEEWFLSLCETRSQEVYGRAEKDLGAGINDNDQLIEYMNQHPDSGRYFFYFLFFKNVDYQSGTLRELIDLYPVFGAEMGQDPAYYLSEKAVLLPLIESYRKQFDRYYDKFVFTGANATGLGM